MTTNFDLLLFPLLAVMSLFIILCFILCMVCLSKCGRLKKAVKSDELEEKVYELEDVLSKLSKSTSSPQITSISDKSSFKRIGIVKFDAFDGITGSYSFSVALLNDNLDGIILTSLFGRETCNTYLREISKGKSDTQLLKEEISALEKAIKNEV